MRFSGSFFGFHEFRINVALEYHQLFFVHCEDPPKAQQGKEVELLIFSLLVIWKYFCSNHIFLFAAVTRISISAGSSRPDKWNSSCAGGSDSSTRWNSSICWQHSSPGAAIGGGTSSYGVPGKQVPGFLFDKNSGVWQWWNLSSQMTNTSHHGSTFSACSSGCGSTPVWLQYSNDFDRRNRLGCDANSIRSDWLLPLYCIAYTSYAAYP